ncbi:MAG: hypothetical protein PHF63_01855 [Herbinix sp.]|nr:hypothetical protein [Herbinix sp.]
MDRNPMYRMPTSPGSVIKKLSEGKQTTGYQTAEQQTTGKPVADKSSVKNYDAWMPVINNFSVTKRNTDPINNKSESVNRTAERPLADKPLPEKQLKSKPVEFKIDYQKSGMGSANNKGSFVSTEQLQEAIIWSEILGKPVSKRRKLR